MNGRGETAYGKLADALAGNAGREATAITSVVAEVSDI